jgi:hypothetical protein
LKHIIEDKISENATKRLHYSYSNIFDTFDTFASKEGSLQATTLVNTNHTHFESFLVPPVHTQNKSELRAKICWRMPDVAGRRQSCRYSFRPPSDFYSRPNNPINFCSNKLTKFYFTENLKKKIVPRHDVGKCPRPSLPPANSNILVHT